MQRWLTLLVAAATLPLPAIAVAKDEKHHDADALKQNFLAEHEIGRRFRSIPPTCRRRNPGRSSPTVR